LFKIVREFGYTLLEMLITLAIIAILSALLIPSHAWLYADAKQTTASQQLLRAVSMARGAALLHGATVTLCGGRDAACSGQWSDGQILFLDAERKGSVRDASDVLFVFDALSGALVHWRSALAKNYLSMNAAGTTDDEDGTFWYCATGAKNPAWAMRINQTGRARLEYPNSRGSIEGLSC
jgi:type IV fimbrial biogenesis protein FimT